MVARSWLIPIGAVVAVMTGLPPAHAQPKSLNLALKGGESVEVSDLYFVLNCRSQLTGTPTVSVLEGPPGVTAVVTPAQVVPRAQQCSKPVAGGKLTLKADKIDDESSTTMTLRVAYATKDGPRQVSMTIALSLFPSD